MSKLRIKSMLHNEADILEVNDEDLSSNVAVKLEVSNITSLTNEQLDNLKAGDIVTKKTGNALHTYVVSYKGEGAGSGICLTYTASGYIETVSYDRSGSGWVYNSTDISEVPTDNHIKDLIQADKDILNQMRYDKDNWPIFPENIIPLRIVSVKNNQSKVYYFDYSHNKLLNYDGSYALIDLEGYSPLTIEEDIGQIVEMDYFLNDGGGDANLNTFKMYYAVTSEKVMEIVSDYFTAKQFENSWSWDVVNDLLVIEGFSSDNMPIEMCLSLKFVEDGHSYYEDVIITFSKGEFSEKNDLLIPDTVAIGEYDHYIKFEYRGQYTISTLEEVDLNYVITASLSGEIQL